MQIFQTILFTISSFLLTIWPTSQFVEGVVGQPRSFLPHLTVTETDKTISSLIYRGLFKYDIYGALIPDLAEKWDISEDGIVYTVTLKPDQTWSDGSPVTVDDVIYTSFKMPQLRDVATDKIDDRTIRFTLPNKYSPFPNLLTVPIMKANSEEDFDGLMPVSNGQFRVIDIKRSGPVISEVVLADIQSETPNFKKLIFKYYTNEEELLTGAKLGEVDAFTHSTELLNNELENFQNYKFPLQGVYYSIYFNLENEELQDIEVRRQLEQSLPKEDIIAPFGILVQGPISRNDYTDTSINFDPYDEDLVGDLSNLGPFQLILPDLEVHEAVANRIKDQWENVLGLDVELNKFDPDEINELVIKDRQFELLLYGQETSRDPDRYVNWHSTQHNHPGLNLSQFEHVRSDRALEEGRNTTEFSERVVHYNEFQEVILEEVPAIFLYHPYVNYYVSSKIQGIGEKYTFSMSDRFLDFNAWDRVDMN